MEEAQHGQETDLGSAVDMGTAQHYLSSPQHDVSLNQHDMAPPQHDMSPGQHDTGTSQHMLPPQHDMGALQHGMDAAQHDMGIEQHDGQAGQEQTGQEQAGQEQVIDPTTSDPTAMDPAAMDPASGYLIGQEGQYYNYAAHSAAMLQAQGADMGHMDPNQHWQQQGEPPPGQIPPCLSLTQKSCAALRGAAPRPLACSPLGRGNIPPFERILRRVCACFPYTNGCCVQAGWPTCRMRTWATSTWMPWRSWSACSIPRRTWMWCRSTQVIPSFLKP